MSNTLARRTRSNGFSPLFWIGALPEPIKKRMEAWREANATLDPPMLQVFAFTQVPSLAIGIIEAKRVHGDSDSRPIELFVNNAQHAFKLARDELVMALPPSYRAIAEGRLERVVQAACDAMRVMRPYPLSAIVCVDTKCPGGRHLKPGPWEEPINRLGASADEIVSLAHFALHADAEETESIQQHLDELALLKNLIGGGTFEEMISRALTTAIEPIKAMRHSGKPLIVALGHEEGSQRNILLARVRTAMEEARGNVKDARRRLANDEPPLVIPQSTFYGHVKTIVKKRGERWLQAIRSNEAGNLETREHAGSRGNSRGKRGSR